MVATCVITLLLAVMVVLIIRHLVKEHKSGHCATCPYAGSCPKHHHGC